MRKLLFYCLLSGWRLTWL